MHDFAFEKRLAEIAEAPSIFSISDCMEDITLVAYRQRASDEKRGDNSAGTLRESSSHLSMIVLKTQLSGCKRKRSYCPIYDTGQAYIPRVCKYM